MKILKIIATLTATGALAACATTDAEADKSGLIGKKYERDDKRIGEEVSRVCFSNSIRSFSNEDRRSVVIKKGTNKHYLIETYGSCYNLRHAKSLGFDRRSGCVSRGNQLIASSSIMPGFNRDDMQNDVSRCSIKAIYEWDEEVAKEMKEATKNAE